MEGESKDYGREKMLELSKALDKYLATHPETADDFAMQAVARLVAALFAFKPKETVNRFVR
jgi:hypothetical protein